METTGHNDSQLESQEHFDFLYFQHKIDARLVILKRCGTSPCDSDSEGMRGRMSVDLGRLVSPTQDRTGPGPATESCDGVDNTVVALWFK